MGIGYSSDRGDWDTRGQSLSLGPYKDLRQQLENANAGGTDVEAHRRIEALERRIARLERNRR